MNDLASIKPVARRPLPEEEIDLQAVWSAIWSGRLLVSTVVVIAILAASLVWWILPIKYEASTVLLPVSDTTSGLGMSALSSLSSRFEGLASLAGIAMPKDERSTEAVAVLQSEKLTQDYIQSNNLLPILYRRDWDRDKQAWKPLRTSEMPTLWKANQYFKRRIRSITIDRQTDLVTLTITWTSPVLAAQWANGLVDMTNDYLRNQAIEESERNIAYLKQQAAQTDLVDLRQDIYSIMQSEISRAMLARGNKEYALKVIDPAFVPGKPSSLSLSAWIAIGFVCGVLLGITIVIVRKGLGNEAGSARQLS